MPKVKEIVDYFARLVPDEMKLDFDNVGPLVGLHDAKVNTVVVALDITDEVIDEAVSENAQLIISHHPLFFELKQVREDSPIGVRVMKLIQNGISALCLHTNLDQVKGGVNDALAKRLGIEVEGFLSEELTTRNGESYGMGRFGTLSNPMVMDSFSAFVKDALNAPGLRYLDAGKWAAYRVAVCGGTGGSYIEAARARNCDTLVTSDVKHHEFQKAASLGLNIIDGGHYHTENVVIPVLADMLTKGFPELRVIISNAAEVPIRFVT